MQDLWPNFASQLPPLSPAMAASVFVKSLDYSTAWWEVQVARQAALEKLDQSSLKGRTLSVRADKTAQQQDTANSKRRKTDADAAAADAKTTAPAARKDRVDSSAADASKDRPKGSQLRCWPDSLKLTETLLPTCR
jgi:hypothetical protein